MELQKAGEDPGSGSHVQDLSGVGHVHLGIQARIKDKAGDSARSSFQLSLSLFSITMVVKYRRHIGLRPSIPAG